MKSSTGAWRNVNMGIRIIWHKIQYFSSIRKLFMCIRSYLIFPFIMTVNFLILLFLSYLEVGTEVCSISPHFKAILLSHCLHDFCNSKWHLPSHLPWRDWKIFWDLIGIWSLKWVLHSCISCFCLPADFLHWCWKASCSELFLLYFLLLSSQVKIKYLHKIVGFPLLPGWDFRDSFPSPKLWGAAIPPLKVSFPNQKG